MSTDTPINAENLKRYFIPNRRQRRQGKGREFSNKKGMQIVVYGIYKYRKVFQRIGNKTIVHSVLSHPIKLRK